LSIDRIGPGSSSPVEPQPVIFGKRDAKATVVRRDCARLDPFTGSTRIANAATAGRFMTLARLSFDDSLLEKPLNLPHRLK
jgi:hypothetical protein